PRATAPAPAYPDSRRRGNRGVGYAGSATTCERASQPRLLHLQGICSKNSRGGCGPPVVRQAIRRFFHPAAGGRRQRAAKFAAANRCLSLKIDAATPLISDEPTSCVLVLYSECRRPTRAPAKRPCAGIRPCAVPLRYCEA